MFARDEFLLVNAFFSPAKIPLLLPRNTTSSALSIPSQEVFALYIIIYISPAPLHLAYHFTPASCPKVRFFLLFNFCRERPLFSVFHFCQPNSVPVAVKHFNTLYTYYITQLLVKLIKPSPSGWLPPHCCYCVF